MFLRSVLFLTLLACLHWAAPAAAQFDLFFGTYIEDSCAGDAVVLDVSTWEIDTVPSEYVGWIIQRRVVGKCVPHVQIGGIRPFEADEFIIVDTPEEEGYATLYRTFAVDEAGGLHNVLYWGQRTHHAFADCLGHPAARGTVTAYGDYRYLDVCPEDCWIPLSMLDPSVPPEAYDLVGVVIDIYGELILGMEGHVVQITDWQISPNGCGPVPSRDTSWGALKARFR